MTQTESGATRKMLKCGGELTRFCLKVNCVAAKFAKETDSLSHHLRAS
jgi:hypothetical protein